MGRPLSWRGRILERSVDNKLWVGSYAVLGNEAQRRGDCPWKCKARACFGKCPRVGPAMGWAEKQHNPMGGRAQRGAAHFMSGAETLQVSGALFARWLRTTRP
eukprot:7416658-Alexandrium_andersonii.AAC.1